VNRDQVVLNEKGLSALDAVETEIQHLIYTLCASSPYAAINLRIAGLPHAPATPRWWYDTEAQQAEGAREREPIGRIVPMQFPVSFGHERTRTADGAVVHRYEAVDVGQLPTGSVRLTWYDRSTPPDRVVFVAGSTFDCVWEHDLNHCDSRWRGLMPSAFPPPMSDFVIVEFHLLFGPGPVVVNASHELIRAIHLEQSSWIFNLFGKDLDPRPLRNELLADPSNAAAWILQCLRYHQNNLWTALLEQDPKLLESIWISVFPGGMSKKLYLWSDRIVVEPREGRNWGRVEAVTVNNWSEESGIHLMKTLTKKIRREWRLKRNP
jgi:hypothetical protein